MVGEAPSPANIENVIKNVVSINLTAINHFWHGGGVKDELCEVFGT